MAKKQTKHSTFGNAVRRMFGLKEKKQLSFQEEEALQSPGRVVARNFFHKPTAVFGLVFFLLIFVFVMVGPYFMPIDLGHSDSNLANIAPGYSMMDVPDQLIEEGIADIVAGQIYGIGLSEAGKIYTWGYTTITDTIDMSNVPVELTDGEVEVVFMAAGNDHAVAMDKENNLYFWGNTRLGQDRYQSNPDLARLIRTNSPDLKVKQLEAGNQFSAILVALLFRHGYSGAGADQSGGLYRCLQLHQKIPADGGRHPRTISGHAFPDRESRKKHPTPRGGS